MWSFQVMRIIGQSHFGGGQVSECLQAAERITLGDYESWHREWMRLGDRSLTRAGQALEQGRTDSARTFFLHASNYIRTAEFFLQPDDPRKMPTYRAGIEAFRSGAERMARPPEAVRIPFEGSFLPGYFYPAPDGGKAPLVIAFGGLDSTAEELYFCAVQALQERGLAVLAMDGPGQGGALRLNNIASRPEYETAGTAALEWALARPEVDADRVAIMAWSMGGYYAPRMAAFEPRFKACAVWGAVYDYSEVWERRPDEHPLARILEHVLGVSGMPAARERLKQFTLKGVLGKIHCPTYILHGEEDRQVPVDHAYRSYEELTCSRTLKVFTKEETGSAHCQADNLAQAHSHLFDWLQGELAK